MAAYFDGSQPSWDIVSASGIRSRRIVEDIVLRFRQKHASAARPLVELLTGAGGEGKSTALLQAAAALARDGTQRWSCLHRVSANAGLSDRLLQDLEPRDGHAWIVAIDEAENIGKRLVPELKRIAPRTDIHILLAAREADWALTGPKRDLWYGIAEFRRTPMPALDADDARRIVDGWHAQGEETMGRLRGAPLEDAADALLKYARDHAARRGKGALLGALLATRDGQDLKDRVRAFVGPLRNRGRVHRFDLRDIYAMIAAMHAENQLYLLPGVLAAALACEEDILQRPLAILQQEAMLDSGRTHILTRHRRIAEVACEVLREDGYDVEQWYPRLAAASRRAFLKNSGSNPHTAKWNFELANHFARKGPSHFPQARQIAKAILDVEPGNVHLLSAYSQVLRETKQPRQAMDLLKNNAELCRSDRGLIYEWSVAAGQAHHPIMAIWLAARSLADAPAGLDAKRCERSLDGLTYAFAALHAVEKKPIFARAKEASARLGLRVPDLADDTRGHLERIAASGPVKGTPALLKDDLDALKLGAARAADEMEPAEDGIFLERLFGDPREYGYSSLTRILSGYA